jgi:hypothetical protein
MNNNNNNNAASRACVGAFSVMTIGNSTAKTNIPFSSTVAVWVPRADLGADETVCYGVGLYTKCVDRSTLPPAVEWQGKEYIPIPMVGVSPYALKHDTQLMSGSLQEMIQDTGCSGDWKIVDHVDIHGSMRTGAIRDTLQGSAYFEKIKSPLTIHVEEPKNLEELDICARGTVCADPYAYIDLFVCKGKKGSKWCNAPFTNPIKVITGLITDGGSSQMLTADQSKKNAYCNRIKVKNTGSSVGAGTGSSAGAQAAFAPVTFATA